MTIFISGCSSVNSSSNETGQSLVSPSPVRLASDVPWIDKKTPSGIDNEERFKKVLQDFINVDCKRGIGKEIYALPESHWGIEYYPLYLNRYPKEFFWGNSLDKVKVVLASLEMSLAMSESKINELDYAPRKKSLKQDFRLWDKYSQKIARQVCQETGLSEEETNNLLLQMLFDYKKFAEWFKSVRSSYFNQMEEYELEGKPKCTEYPSDNPKYSIVKCTNLP
jgi:hypothetical protein